MQEILAATASKVAKIGAFAAPLVMGVFFASPEPYWLDSPEFTAAAQTLGVPHPPGHPLYVMLVKPFTLLPIGSIGFRVSVASALFAALACFLLCDLTIRLLARCAEDLPDWCRAVIALCAALAAAAAPGWWFQAVRAEVYALQILLVMAFLHPLVSFCLDREGRRLELLYLAAFALGLGLTNHHFIMLAALPAALGPLVALTKRLGGRGAVWLSGKLAAAASLGTLPYLFLPLRSAAGAPISLGAVHSVSDFAWVVSAKAYQKSMAQEHVDGLGHRAADALLSTMGELGPVLVVASIAGIYTLLRWRETRMAGLVLALVAVVTLLLRAIMGIDPFNPDYYGYLTPAVAALAIAAAVFAGSSLSVIAARLSFGRWLAPVLAVALVAIPICRAHASMESVDLRDFKATRLLYDAATEGASPGSLVLVSYYKLFFVLWSARHIDGSRPDIAVVNPQLFGYPGYLRAALDELPRLRPLAWSMVVDGRITESAIADLAMDGPLRVEPSPWLEEQAALHLVPAGPLYQATPEPMGRSDVEAALLAHDTRWRRFYALLGTGWNEHETWRMLSWYHYLDAVFMAGRGARAGALKAVEMARALGNSTPQIAGLEAALREEGDGPIDVSPFFPSAMKPERATKKVEK